MARMQKKMRILSSQNVVIEQSSFKCPDCKFEQHRDLQLFLPMQGLVCCETLSRSGMICSWLPVSSFKQGLTWQVKQHISNDHV